MNILIFSLFWLATPDDNILRPIDSVKVCPKTNMVNVTKYPWNDYDQEVLGRANKRCGQIYPGSGCVKMFKKWGKKDYSVICGEKE